MRLAAGGVLRKYFFSYMSVVLLVCVITGAALLSLSGERLESMAKTEQQNRLKSAANDIETQFDVMREISLRVQTSAIYLPSYIQVQPVNEITLINDLAKYRDYSPIIQQYYLCYEEPDSVYSGSAKYSFDIFAKYLLGLNDAERARLDSALSNASSGTAILLTGDSDIFAVSYDITFNSSSRARMLFLLPKDSLVSRVAYMSGLDKSRIDVHTGGAAEDGYYIDLSSGLSVSLSGDGDYAKYSDMIVNGLLITLGIALVCSIAALFLARRNYRPIGRLMRTYSQGGSVSDEFAAIEGVLKSAVESNLDSHNRMKEMVKLLEEQSRTIRMNLFRLLLNGDNPPAAIAELKRLGVALGGRYFSPVVLKFSGAKIDDGELEARLGELSDENAAFHLADKSGADTRVVLVNVDDIQSTAYAFELMTALGTELAGCSGVIYKNMTDANGISEMLSQIERRSPDPKAKEGEFARSMLENFKNELRGINSDAAVMVLRESMAEAEMLYASALDRKGLMAGALEALIAEAKRAGAAGHSETLQQALSESDTGAFIDRIKPVIYDICLKNAGDDARGSERELLEYINAHYTEYDMSLDRLAGEFKKSDWRVSRMIADATGMPYKEYVINLRMKLARKLLVESKLSVNEIGERIGYVNVSHFIKSFKAIHGSTPAAYRSGQAGQ